MTNKDVVDLRVAGLDDDNLIAAIKDAKSGELRSVAGRTQGAADREGVEPRDHGDARPHAVGAGLQCEAVTDIRLCLPGGPDQPLPACSATRPDANRRDR